jgi:hypothetical protein
MWLIFINRLITLFIIRHAGPGNLWVPVSRERLDVASQLNLTGFCRNDGM